MPDPILPRCGWVSLKNPLYIHYHDSEWGRASHEDLHHFEMLVLEGAQAGLSWETILKRRENYRLVFKGFDPQQVAQMQDMDLETALLNPGIIRNRLKVYGARINANVFLSIQKEFGSFDQYVWGFVERKPIITPYSHLKEMPTTTPQSDALSRDLKKRGMTFVGSTIIYAYMQAVGLVNDHTADCWLYGKER